MNRRARPIDALTMIAVLALLIGIWDATILIPRILAHHDTDFSAYYDAGVRLRTAPSTLYDRSTGASFIHPAYEAVLFAPVSTLSYARAYLFFGLLNLSLILWLWMKFNFSWELIALPGLWFTVITGQDSILFLSLICLAWAAARHNYPGWSGAFLGIALFRFQVVLPMLLIFIAWKEWRLIKGFAVSGIIVSAISAVIFSPMKYARMIFELSLNEYPQPVNRMTNLRGLFDVLAPNHSAILTVAATVSILGTGAYFAAHLSLERKFEVSILVASLISYHLFVHDLAILVLPLASIIRFGGRNVAAAVIAVTSVAFFNIGFCLTPLAVISMLICVLWKTSKRSLSPTGDTNIPLVSVC